MPDALPHDHALDTVLQRISNHPRAASELVLRGSRLTRHLVAQSPRPGAGPRDCDNLDFVAQVPWDEGYLLALLDEAVGDRLDAEVIFGHTATPGVRTRHAIEGRIVQLDVGVGDPMVPEPVWCELAPGVRLRCVRAETLAGWKLQGLYEAHDRNWRCKDLHDLWLLLGTPLETEALQAAIQSAFHSRDAPMWRMERLFSREFGSSRGSLDRWRRFGRKYPTRAIPPVLASVVDQVAAALEPLVRPLMEDEPVPSLFAEGLTLEQVQHAIENEPAYTVRSCEGLWIVDRGRVPREVLPPPAFAATFAEHRRRQILRCARGLVFDGQGALLSRKYHALFALSAHEAASVPGPLRAVHKLDGVLVATVRVCGRVSLQTCAGHTEIARAAERFAAEDSPGWASLFERWTAAGHTVLLEWCSRGHRVVERHTEDTLVVTGIRADATGRYLGWDELCATTREAGVPLVEELGLIRDLPAFVTRAEGETQGEGYVLLGEEGPLYKVQNERYLRAHRLRHGEENGPLALQMFLSEGSARLLTLLDDRDISTWLSSLEGALHGLRAEVAQAAQRGRAAIGEDPTLHPAFRRMVFRWLEGRENAVEGALIELLGRACGYEEAMAMLGGSSPELRRGP